MYDSTVYIAVNCVTVLFCELCVTVLFHELCVTVLFTTIWRVCNCIVYIVVKGVWLFCSVAVNRVQLDFGATIINEHPITEGDVQILVSDAKSMIAEENEAIAQGRDPHDLHFDTSRLFRPLPGASRSDDQDSSWKTRVKDKRVSQTAKTNRMTRVVMDSVEADLKGKKKNSTKNAKKSQQKSVTTEGGQNQSRSCVVLW